VLLDHYVVRYVVDSLLRCLLDIVVIVDCCCYYVVVVVVVVVWVVVGCVDLVVVDW